MESDRERRHREKLAEEHRRREEASRKRRPKDYRPFNTPAEIEKLHTGHRCEPKPDFGDTLYRGIVLGEEGALAKAAEIMHANRAERAKGKPG